MAFIVATSTQVPGHYYPQEILATVVRNFCQANKADFNLDVIDQFFNNVLIKGRYFALPIPSSHNPLGLEEAVKLGIEASVDLVETTVETLLQKTELDPQEVSLIASVTVTPAIPSIEARLMGRIPFSPFLKRMPLAGVGCMGGAVGVARVADYLRGHPQEAAIFFAVDLSSILWQGSLQRDLAALIEQLPTDPSQYNNIVMTIVTAALFGDGAGAVLIVGREHPLAQHGLPQVIDSRSIWLPNTQNLMELILIDGGFRQILKPEVADWVGLGLKQAIGSLLSAHHLSIEQITHWIVHPGGPKIMTKIEQEFGLDEQALQLSRTTLARIGNAASPTVLHVLEQTLTVRQPLPGAYGLMIAMGPGFSQEVILLKF